MDNLKDNAIELAKGIIDNSELYHYNDNGPDSYECPFCGKILRYITDRPGYTFDSDHEKNCLVNKAKEFLEKFDK